MTGNEYQKLASRTIASPNKLNQELHGLFGLCSEVGEVHSIYQKMFQEHLFDKMLLIKELGDCLWMIAEICTANDINLDTVFETNIEKLRKRYPNGFDSERSLHREKDDV